MCPLRLTYDSGDLDGWGGSRENDQDEGEDRYTYRFNGAPQHGKNKMESEARNWTKSSFSKMMMMMMMMMIHSS